MIRPSAAALGAATLAAAPLIASAQTTPGDVLPTQGRRAPAPLPTNPAGGRKYRPGGRVGLGGAPPTPDSAAARQNTKTLKLATS